MEKPTLSIIIPVFNEENNIGPFLDELTTEISTRQGRCEVIIVDDGSTDQTAARVSEKLTSGRARGLAGRLVSLPANSGKGAALQKGVFEATSAHLVLVDGDGAFAPEAIWSIDRELLSFSVVLGVKTGYPLFRTIQSRIFNFLVTILFHLPTSDVLCGLKGFRADIARSLFLELHEKGWLFDIEILNKLKGKCAVKTVPVHIRDNPDSKFRPLDPVRILWKMVKMKWQLPALLP